MDGFTNKMDDYTELKIITNKKIGFTHKIGNFTSHKKYLSRINDTYIVKN